MKRLLILFFLLLISVYSISGSDYDDSPYILFGDHTKVLDIQHHNHAQALILYTILPDSAIVYMEFGKDSLYVFDACGNILNTQPVNPTYHALFSAIDPKAFQTPWVSPYVFCFADPISFSDPTGLSPIYSPEGEFLGTDDNGFRGEFYIMNKEDYKKCMSPEDVKKVMISPTSVSESVLQRINDHYKSLESRPDYDGVLTLSEANDWYRESSGQPLFVDINSLNLARIPRPDKKTLIEGRVISLFTRSNSPLTVGLVYGSVTLKYCSSNSVRIYKDTYNFDIKGWNWETIARNIETIIGHYVAGKGKPFEIYFYGTKTF